MNTSIVGTTGKGDVHRHICTSCEKEFVYMTIPDMAYEKPVTAHCQHCNKPNEVTFT